MTRPSEPSQWQSRPIGQPGAGWYPTPEGQRYWDGFRWHAPPPNPNAEVVANPIVGWILLGAGALMVIGSFMAWASALGGLISKSGVDGGDGWLTVIAGVLMAGMGLLIGLKQGGFTPAIFGLVAAIAGGAVAGVDMQDVRSKTLDIGAGLWIVGVAAIAGLAMSVAALLVRDRY